MKNFAFILTFGLLAGVSGCSDEAQPDAASEDLSQAAKKLVGAYRSSEAAHGFVGLVLTSEMATPNANRFFADIDAGEEVERVEGTFTGGTKTITFKSQTASAAAQASLGKYQYQLEDGKLSLSRKGEAQSLEPRESYCGDEPESDCLRQGLTALQTCSGQWACSAEQTCVYDCSGGGGGSCEGGNVVEGDSQFVPSADGMECELPTTHCVTNDPGKCPQVSQLPPDFCPNGEIVAGAKAFVPSADGKECAMPAVHCVTKDASKCPQLSPQPPDYCKDGIVVAGPRKFVPSADGMECSVPSTHCMTKNTAACSAGF